MKHACLCFLLDGTRVLLAQKKTGFGQGKVVGVGGRLEAGESPEAAVRREVKEEIHVTLTQVQQVGEITFTFANKPNWNMFVTLFLSRDWQGRPQESDEVTSFWTDTDALPFEHMWEDSKHWLPILLANQCLNASFHYDADIRLESFDIQEIPC